MYEMQKSPFLQQMEPLLIPFLEGHRAITDIVIIENALIFHHSRSPLFLVIFSYQEKALEAALEHMLQEAGISGVIEGILQEALFNPAFIHRESLLWEGYSVYHKAFFSMLFGYEGLVLFQYELRGLNDSKRMQFYYALHGRGAQHGILASVKSAKLSDGQLLASREAIPLLRQFFNQRHIPTTLTPLLLSRRVAQRLLQ